MSVSPADSIAAREAALEEEFSFFDDALERYELLIDKGRALAPLPPEEQIEAFRVRGCQSQVWIVPQWDGDRLHLRGDSDALITRGLVALVTGVLTGQPAADIARADLGFISRIGLDEHLSPTRKNGLASMIERIKTYARAADQVVIDG